MCKSSLSTLASEPASSRRSRSRLSSSSTPAVTTSSSSSGAVVAVVSQRGAAAPTSSSSTSSTSSSRASLAAARASLPDPPVLYPFQELAAATNNFLSKRISGYWRCSLRGRDAAVFQLRSKGMNAAATVSALARIGKYHHTSLAHLLGACLAGAHVYLVYELPPGDGTLAACLRNPRNPSFTVLRTWVSRVQIAADVAQGLEYIHHHAGAIHGSLSPSTVLLSDPGLRGRLSHLGADDLAAADAQEESPYAAGAPSREADVYSFGVLLLELLSGEEAVRYQFDRETKEFLRVSVVDTAAAAVAGAEGEERSGRIRGWVDRRLGDSFPVAAAERLVEVGLRCAAAAASERPEMTWVAGKVSKVYLESRAWEQKLRVPTEFSVSVAPR